MEQEILNYVIKSIVSDTDFTKAKRSILICGAIAALTELISDLINPGSKKIVSPIVWGVMLFTMWVKVIYDLRIPLLRNKVKILFSVIISGISAFVLHVLIVYIYTFTKILLYKFGILDDMQNIIIDAVIFDPFVRFITIYIDGILFIKLIGKAFKIEYNQ